ncbi:MAG: hypothetical protein QXG65_03110 [Thermoplasmata archaeon]
MASRCVALVTRDPTLYGEIAAAIRERGVPCISLLPGQRIPERVAAVLTTPDEAAGVSHPRILPISEGFDRHSLWAAIGAALAPTPEAAEIVVGLDPGPRPGYSVLAGDALIGEGILDSPEASVGFSERLEDRFPEHRIRYRVGSGDPGPRNRIVNALLHRQRRVEIVDEQGTTPRGHRRPRDMLAARRIARVAGRIVLAPLPVAVTEGEVRNLQRLSRLRSGGRLTISRSMAHRVARGEISLADALARQAHRPGPDRAGEPPALRELL